MRRLSWLSCSICIALWMALPVCADDLKATLELEGSKEKRTAVSESTLKRPRAKPRPVLRATVDESLTVRWKITCSAAKPQEEVLVHFYVAREDKPGQEQAPDLKSDRVVVESALTMDFKDKDSAHGTLTFQINKAGVYLVRVEVEGKETTPLDEPFAALDLEVKEK